MRAKPLNKDVEQRIIWTLYERQYPGCTEKITEVFGFLPTASQVATWKDSWVDPFKIELPHWGADGGVYDIRGIAQRLNIHPFFYSVRGNQAGYNNRRPGSPKVFFYYGEHGVMFKIAMSAVG